MKTSIKLLKCPFCGGKGELQESGVPQFWHVFCLGCHIHGPTLSTKNLAVKAWNRRAK